MVLAYSPRLTAVVTFSGKVSVFGKESEREDVIVCHWHSPVSQDPPLYLVSLSKKLSHPIEIVRSSRVFVVNFVPFSLKDAVEGCARHAGEFVDKFKVCGVRKERSLRVDCSRLADAVSWLECELVQELDFGDHLAIVGRVVHVGVVDASAPKLFHVQGAEFTTTR